MENITRRNEILQNTIEMIDEFLHYGYTYDDFINQDYFTTKLLGKETIKELFAQRREYLSRQ